MWPRFHYLLQFTSRGYSDYRDCGQGNGDSSSQGKVTYVGRETSASARLYIVGKEGIRACTVFGTR